MQTQTDAFSSLPIASDEEEETAEMEISYFQSCYPQFSQEYLEKLVNRDIEIFQERMKAFNARPADVPRAGDFIRMLDGELHRIVHCWPKEWGDDATVQTYPGGSFYLGNGYISHSGACNPGVPYEQIKPTNETAMGSCWIFSQDLSGAGRGATAYCRFRVFELVEAKPNDVTGRERRYAEIRGW